MNNLKSSEAYQYLHSNKVGRVLLKEVGHNLIFLKADVEPEHPTSPCLGLNVNIR